MPVPSSYDGPNGCPHGIGDVLIFLLTQTTAARNTVDTLYLDSSTTPKLDLKDISDWLTSKLATMRVKSSDLSPEYATARPGNWKPPPKITNGIGGTEVETRQAWNKLIFDWTHDSAYLRGAFQHPPHSDLANYYESEVKGTPCYAEDCNGLASMAMTTDVNGQSISALCLKCAIHCWGGEDGGSRMKGEEPIEIFPDPVMFSSHFSYVTGHSEEGHYKSFSNSYISEFTVRWGDDDLHFFNSEQYVMYLKANIFEDFNKAALILKVKGGDPHLCKKMGREIKQNCSDRVKLTRWEDMRLKVMFEALKHKFKQNGAIEDVLVATGHSVIIDATHGDEGMRWGIGLDEGEARKMEPARWPGKNLLGVALSMVRSFCQRSAAKGMHEEYNSIAGNLLVGVDRRPCDVDPQWDLISGPPPTIEDIVGESKLPADEEQHAARWEKDHSKAKLSQTFPSPPASVTSSMGMTPEEEAAFEICSVTDTFCKDFTSHSNGVRMEIVKAGYALKVMVFDDPDDSKSHYSTMIFALRAAREEDSHTLSLSEISKSGAKPKKHQLPSAAKVGTSTRLLFASRSYPADHLEHLDPEIRKLVKLTTSNGGWEEKGENASIRNDAIECLCSTLFFNISKLKGLSDEKGAPAMCHHGSVFESFKACRSAPKKVPVQEGPKKESVNQGPKSIGRDVALTEFLDKKKASKKDKKKKPEPKGKKAGKKGASVVLLTMTPPRKESVTGVRTPPVSPPPHDSTIHPLHVNSAFGHNAKEWVTDHLPWGDGQPDVDD